MQAIISTIEILLIDSNQTQDSLIEHLLLDAESQDFRLVKVQNYHDLEFIQLHNPALIFYIFNQHEDHNLDNLFKLQKANHKKIPLIIISNIMEFDLQSFPIEVDDYLIQSEICTDSLKRTIFLALKRDQSRRKAELISDENTELSSQLLITKNLFQTIIDNTSTLIWMCDANGNSTFFNQAWSKLLEQRIETILTSNWMLNIHPQDLGKCQHKFDQSLATKKGFTISYRLKSCDQQYRWISNYAVPQFTLNGDFKGLVGYCFDITAHKKIEQKLIRQAASDRLLAQITQKIHASLDLDQILQTTVAEVNQFLQAEKIQINKVDQASKLSTLFESRLNGQSLSCDLAQDQRFYTSLFHNNQARLSKGQIVIQDYSDVSTVQGKICSGLMVSIIVEQKLWGILYIEQCFKPRVWTTEEIKLLERVAMELSVAINQAKLYQQLEKANQELEQLSVVDGLTKIANRRKFDQYMVAEWTRLSREQNPLSLILCDIDYFKLYNDTYGHQAGDRCLQEVAQAISKVIKRPADLVARYGGEEFVLVLPNTPVAGAKHLAQQVRWQIEALRLPHINSPVDLYLTLSLGVSSCIPDPNFSFDMLVAAADKGLYQAKKKGRNRVVEYEIKPQ